MKLTIIIPTLNEEAELRELLTHLENAPHRNYCEILIVDGGSKDGTISVASDLGFSCLKSKRSRAAQMNLGVEHATGNVLYFIHADARPPNTFYQDIKDCIEKEFDAGCYRFKFNSSKPLLKLNGYFTRFNRLWCRGGDQTLFIKKSLFKELGGYNEYYSIMEEYELIKTLMSKYSFKIIPKDAIVSARKYDSNGWFKVQLTNLKAFWMYRNGCHPDKIKEFYSSRLQ